MNKMNLMAALEVVAIVVGMLVISTAPVWGLMYRLWFM